MLEYKEEKRANRVLDTYINQNVTTQSNSSPIHSRTLKGRLSFGSIHNSPHSKRKVIRIRQNSKKELPVLGHKCNKEQPIQRMYESLIIASDAKREPQIKRVKLSEIINNFTQCQVGQIKRRTQTDASHKKKMLTYVDNKSSLRKKKKVGYEGQKLRIQQAQYHKSRFLSNYERFQNNGRLKDVMGELKEEVLRTNSNCFLLLQEDK